MVPDTCWRDVSNSVALIKRYARKCGYRDSKLELHGKELFQGERRGNGWGAVSFPDRISIYEQCLDVLVQHDLKISLGCCDKHLLAKRYAHPEHPHAIAMWLCLERVARFAAKQGTIAFVVADDCTTEIRKISRKVLYDYRKNGAPFGGTVDFSCLIDTIHFMDSAESAHIQLCDLALYAIRKYEATQNARIKPLATVALSRVWDRRTIPY